jgi:hypothetical protein
MARLADAITEAGPAIADGTTRANGRGQGTARRRSNAAEGKFNVNTQTIRSVMIPGAAAR